MQQWCRSVAVVQSEVPVIRLNIALPDLFAAEREAGKLAVPRHDPDELTIGDGGRRSGILFAEHLVPGIDLLLPPNRSILPIDRQQKQLVSPAGRPDLPRGPTLAEPRRL